MNYILDENGQPKLELDILKWGAWFQTAREQRRVAKTTIGDSDVSTVFLGIDHQFGDGPPVLWETMVFGGELDQEQERYTSLESARAGHEAMVARVRAETEADMPTVIPARDA